MTAPHLAPPVDGYGKTLPPKFWLLARYMEARGWRATSGYRDNEANHRHGLAVDFAPHGRTTIAGPKTAASLTSGTLQHIESLVGCPVEVLAEWDHIHIGVSRSLATRIGHLASPRMQIPDANGFRDTRSYIMSDNNNGYTETAVQDAITLASQSGPLVPTGGPSDLDSPLMGAGGPDLFRTDEGGPEDFGGFGGPKAIRGGGRTNPNIRDLSKASPAALKAAVNSGAISPATAQTAQVAALARNAAAIEPTPFIYSPNKTIVVTRTRFGGKTSHLIDQGGALAISADVNQQGQRFVPVEIPFILQGSGEWWLDLDAAMVTSGLIGVGETFRWVATHIAVTAENQKENPGLSAVLNLITGPSSDDSSTHDLEIKNASEARRLIITNGGLLDTTTYYRGSVVTGAAVATGTSRIKLIGLASGYTPKGLVIARGHAWAESYLHRLKGA